MSETIYLKQMELGPMQNFIYLVGDPATRQCVVVDPAWEIDTIVQTAAADDMTIIAALITHTHQDHVGGHLFGMNIPGVEELLEKVKAKVYVRTGGSPAIFAVDPKHLGDLPKIPDDLQG